MTQKSVLTRILSLTNQECVISECEEAMNMIPLSTFEFTPEEIRALIVCIEHRPLMNREILGRVRRKLEFALTRFKPHPK